MTEIEKVDIPLITQVENFIDGRSDEVFKPGEVVDHFTGVSPSSVRTALLSLYRKGVLDRMEFTHNAVYYGKPEAIKRLEEKLNG